MRYLAYLGRFLVMGAVVLRFLVRYGAGRLVLRGEALITHRGRTLRDLLSALGATFVKLGQVLSTRPDLLPPGVIAELKLLQDRMPPFPFARVRQIVEEDLQAPLAERFLEFDETPVAAASVAQVHRARLRDGAEVAVKVLRPDIRQKVERDAAILLFLARVVALHPVWRLSDPVGHLRAFVKGIVDQTDLAREVENSERFTRNFQGVRGVRFPQVVPAASSARVLTMEFVRGHKLDALPAGEHRLVADRLQKAILKMCFADGFVHADLHPGNLLIAPSGELIILDLGLVKHLGGDLLPQFTDFVRCLVMGTPTDFMEHIRQYHTYAKVDWTAFEQDITALVRRFRHQNVGELELGKLADDMFALGRRHRVRPLPDLALVIVGLVTAEGIGKQLYPNNNMFKATAAFLAPLLAQRQAATAAPSAPN